MRFQQKSLAVWFGLLALVVSAPAVAEDLVVPGSGSPEWVLTELASAFNKQQSAHKVTVPPSTGTAGGIRAVEEGKAVLGRVGRPLRPAELARGLVYVGLGRDPIVMAAGASVTAKNITREQVLGVYAGRITDWKALGGKPGPIRAVGRENEDAGRQSLNQTIAGLADIALAPQVKVALFDPQVIDLLDRFGTSLAFLNRSGLAAAKTPLVYLTLDGVEALPQNVASGRYTAFIDMGFVHKTGNPGGAASAFMAFVKSSAGIKILRDNGIIATP